MGLLDKLFGGGKKAAVLVEAPPCPHVALAPRWGNAQDMGKEAKATSYICDACRQEFTPEEARGLKQGLADRLIAQDATRAEAKAAAESREAN